MNNLNGSITTIYDEAAKRNEIACINSFIEKFDLSKIKPPRIPARNLMNTQLNKDGTPKRPMNHFFCFKRVFYLEVLDQELLGLAKDGVFITKVAGEVWKNFMSPSDRKVYQTLSEEVKNLQFNFHKNKNYDKKRNLGTTFHNIGIEHYLGNGKNKHHRRNRRPRMTKQTNQKQIHIKSKQTTHDHRFQSDQSERSYQQIIQKETDDQCILSDQPEQNRQYVLSYTNMKQEKVQHDPESQSQQIPQGAIDVEFYQPGPGLQPKGYSMPFYMSSFDIFPFCTDIGTDETDIMTLYAVGMSGYESSKDHF